MISHSFFSSLTPVPASFCHFMQPHVADGHIMHGGWVSIMLHMGAALQGH